MHPEAGITLTLSTHKAPHMTTGTPGLMPGIEEVSDSQGTAPQILVIAREKRGKSTLGTTLVNWPSPGMQPLYFAFDKTGPNSCLKLGYRPQVMNLHKLAPGLTMIEKARDGLSRLEANVLQIRQQYGAIIVDCASTMTEYFYEDARKGRNKDSRSWYGMTLANSREVMHRIHALGLPVVWLGWLREPETVEDKVGEQMVKRLVPGGLNTVGNFKVTLAGKVQHIFILEKVNVGKHPAADEDGFVRVFHTRDFGNIVAGGRYSHLVPAEVPANLAQVFNLVLGRPA